MVADWKSSWWRSLSKQNHMIVKVAVSVLLAGLAFRLLFSRSVDIPEAAETEIIFLEDGVASAPSSLQLSVAPPTFTPSTLVDQVAPTGIPIMFFVFFCVHFLFSFLKFTLLVFTLWE